MHVDVLFLLYVNANYVHAVAPSVNIQTHFGTDSVTVSDLLWTHKHGVTYSISVDQQVAFNYTGRNGAQLVVPYNTKYNVTVVASLCENNRTTVSMLNYGKLKT